MRVCVPHLRQVSVGVPDETIRSILACTEILFRAVAAVRTRGENMKTSQRIKIGGYLHLKVKCCSAGRRVVISRNKKLASRQLNLINPLHK